MNRTKYFHFRLSEKEHARLFHYANLCQMTEAEFMRSLLSGYAPKAAPPYNYYLMIKELNRIGGNLNQIARAANESGIVDAHKYKTVAGYLFEQIEAIKKAVCDPIPIEDFQGDVDGDI